MQDVELEETVNGLSGIKLDRVELTPYVTLHYSLLFHTSNGSSFHARFRWEKLPPGFKITFPKPVVVKYHDEHVLNAIVGEIASEMGELLVDLSLPDENTGEERCVAYSSPPPLYL